MIFLVEHDTWPMGDVRIRVYRDRGQAEEERFERELRLFRSGVKRSVVLFEAESLGAFRLGHGRYFGGSHTVSRGD